MSEGPSTPDLRDGLHSATLTLSCPNRPGIVAAVATAIFEAGGNITEAQQFDDVETGRFFMRVVLDVAATELLRQRLAAVADRLAIDWTLRSRAAARRVMLLVSKFDHCLADLLYR